MARYPGIVTEPGRPQERADRPTDVVSAAEGPAAAARLAFDHRQRVVVLAPVALIAVMLPVFQLSRALVGDAAGGWAAWFAGMVVYWLVWGWVFSRWVLGRDRVRALIRPQRLSLALVGQVGFIVVMAAVVRFAVPGMGYSPPTVAAAVLLGLSPFANGVFEELLWRGVYLDVFPDRPGWRVAWPSIWFGLWHLVPATIEVGGPHPAMVIGPVLMGLYLAWLAKKTTSVWGPILAHTLGGLVMIS